jgi:hypothetical protein
MSTATITLLPTETKPAKVPAKRGRKRSSLQRAQDLAEIERLALQNVPHLEIARRINAQRRYTLSRQTITHDLGKLAARYEATALEGVGVQRARAFRRLDLTESEAWQAWEKSQKLKEPNSGFLRLVLDCHDRRCKLAGLEAPSRVELSGANGGPIELQAGPLTEPRKLEILRRHIARLEQAEAAKAPALATG